MWISAVARQQLLPLIHILGAEILTACLNFAKKEFHWNWSQLSTIIATRTGEIFGQTTPNVYRRREIFHKVRKLFQRVREAGSNLPVFPFGSFDVMALFTNVHHTRYNVTNKQQEHRWVHFYNRICIFGTHHLSVKHERHVRNLGT